MLKFLVLSPIWKITKILKSLLSLLGFVSCFVSLFVRICFLFSRFFSAMNVSRTYLLQRGLHDEYLQLGTVLESAQNNSVAQSQQLTLLSFFSSAPSSSSLSSSSASGVGVGSGVSRKRVAEDSLSEIDLESASLHSEHDSLSVYPDPEAANEDSPSR